MKNALVWLFDTDASQLTGFLRSGPAAGRAKLLLACSKAVCEPPNPAPASSDSPPVAPTSGAPAASADAAASSGDTKDVKEPPSDAPATSVAKGADKPGNVAAPIASAGDGAASATTPDPSHPPGAPTPATTTSDPVGPSAPDGASPAPVGPSAPDGASPAPSRFDHVAPPTFLDTSEPAVVTAANCLVIPTLRSLGVGLLEWAMDVVLAASPGGITVGGLVFLVWLQLAGIHLALVFFFIAAVFFQAVFFNMTSDISDEEARIADPSAPAVEAQADVPYADAYGALDPPIRSIEVNVRVNERSICFFDITSGHTIQDLLDASEDPGCASVTTCFRVTHITVHTTAIALGCAERPPDFITPPSSEDEMCTAVDFFEHLQVHQWDPRVLAGSLLSEAEIGGRLELHFVVGALCIVMVFTGTIDQASILMAQPRLCAMHPRNRWGADTPHCALGQPGSAGDFRQDPLLPRKKRFSWQRPSSPASEAPPFVPKRPLLGSCQASTPPQVSVTATQVGNLTAFPPACPVKPYIGAPGTVHQAYSLALQMQVTEWVRLARLAASHSSTLPEVLKSSKADVHLAKMVDSYAPSTLAAYLSKWRHWVRLASACEANPYDPSIALLLDFLATNSRGKLRTATTWIKSLRFISRKAHLDALRSSLHSELVSAYGRSGSIIERRESAPLPLSFVIFLERRVLDTSLSAQQRIIAGSFLLCIFASLRFSDALWCPPGRLSITGECLLGVCLKTKTTRRATPFGALAGGFLHRGAQGWAHAWLHLVQVALQATAMLHPSFTPDFILAAARLGPDAAQPLFLAPMSRSEGIVLLRQLFSICYAQTQPSSRPEADLLGVHSLKVTLLSYGRQLLIREDLQRQQGHHRSSLAGMSDLYGRDDVAAPLEFQRQVVAAVLEGFRPRRPRLRGGLPATVDIEVALPCVPGASDMPPMPPVGANPVPDAEHDTSSDSEVEDERAASPIPLPPPTQELPEAVTEALSMTLEPLPQDASSSSGAADDWRSRCCILLFVLSLAPAQKEELIFSCAPQLMAHSSSSTSESASTSFSSEIELFLEAPSADWQPAVRIRPRHFHEARLVYLLFMSTRTERAILLRDEITIWEKRFEDMSLPSGLLDTLVDKGFNSMALLAFAVPDSDSLEHFIVSIVGRPLGADPSAPLLTADAAALRRLYHLCKTECAGVGPSAPSCISPMASVKKSLSKEEVAGLMQKFMKAYPSELVRSDVMPSCPFLLLVREHLEAGKFSWIPWRLRSSASEEEECIASVPQSGPVEPIVRRFWDLLMYAIALNDGAHLLHLRKAAEKFISIALATPSDRNMRPPSLQEIVEADRALWLGVATIQADQGWSLTDALAEMIFARPDVYSALAPRLKPNTPPTPPAASGANKRKQPALPPPPPHKQARPAKAKAKATSKKDAAPKAARGSRVNPDSACALVGSDAPPDFAAPSESSAEVLASTLLEAVSAPSCSDILLLAEALLCEAPDLDDRFESGKSVSAGLFFRFKPGARKVCVSHPSSVRAINRLIRALAPNHFFSSFVIISGVHSPRHQDSMNARAPNIVIPLTSFSGGELRISCATESASGSARPPSQFVDLPVASGPVTFNARDCPHEVLPSQGLRVVLAAYTLQAAFNLDTYPELRSSLTALAFPLPPVDMFYSPEDLAPQTSRLHPRVLPAGNVALLWAPAVFQVPHLVCSWTCLRGLVHRFRRLYGTLVLTASQLWTYIIVDASCNILDDAFCNLLCRIADAGLVGAALAAPVCSKHSILRLRPGGPKPLRDFAFPTGRPDLNWEDTAQLQESALLHDRSRLLLSRVSASGGLILLENPASSLTFHDPLMMSWIESEAPFCAQVASCMVGASFSKSWMFVSNQPCILDLACSCMHAPGTHASFVGKRDGSGFLSRCTAEYPDQLASSLASLCAPFLTSLGSCSEFSGWRALLPSDDVLHDLRHRWSRRLFDAGLCMRLAAHLQLAPQEPPLSDSEVEPFLRDLFAAFQVPPADQADLLFIAPGQPLRLRLLKFLLSKLQDPEAALCDQLESGVSLGVGSALEPSLHWPTRDAEHIIPELHICE
ncbi:unnamed protein product, partial [Symbiodinium microadriaticum]